ncbi:DUF305 domain-containing protein [Nocardiopsis potens]|uniref:DUF305 domain-containing protein n=1 Tax=Nocardiopsis potens TaxID=1246458 RepID=UPI00034CB4A1|nr:DUF305 domain-containing protein [Nocardiopsis potens]
MHRWVPAAVAAALLLTTACSGSEAADAPPVLDPGAPGDTASPASQEQIDAADADVRHNEADVEYVLKMIEHHTQALEMTDLVEERVERDSVEKIAGRIAAAQEPEIEAMETWLEDNVYGPAEGNPNYADQCGLTAWRDGGGAGHHGGGDCPIDIDHTDMPGMVAQEDLDDLEAAEGDGFDRLFVELMTSHHEGAIEMAQDATVDGKHPDVLRMADDVVAEQSADIERMELALED